MLVYLSIFIAAILEGEIYYIAMCVAAGAGKLRWEGVLIAGALGGSAGDQFWFYLLRGRIHWLDRYPWLARHRDAVVHRVKCQSGPASCCSAASCRACARRFRSRARTPACGPSGFPRSNLISAFAWASAIMLVVVKLGPNAMSALGLKGWWGDAGSGRRSSCCSSGGSDGLGSASSVSRQADVSFSAVRAGSRRCARGTPDRIRVRW